MAAAIQTLARTRSHHRPGGEPCGVDQVPGVADGSVVADVSVGEADPIGVVEGVCAPKAIDQLDRVIEVQRVAFHPVSEGAEGRRVAGERPHRLSIVQQTLGDVAASVAEGAGDYGEPGFTQRSCLLNHIQGQDSYWNRAGLLRLPSDPGVA